jgi:hypothetical protein
VVGAPTPTTELDRGHRSETLPRGRGSISRQSTVINDWGGKFGGRAVKAVDLTSGGLRCVPDSGLRPS